MNKGLLDPVDYGVRKKLTWSLKYGDEGVTLRCYAAADAAASSSYSPWRGIV